MEIIQYLPAVTFPLICAVDADQYDTDPSIADTYFRSPLLHDNLEIRDWFHEFSFECFCKYRNTTNASLSTYVANL